VSVESKEGSWEKLLQEFSRKSGIIFHLNIPLEGTVTASFKDLPLERALKRLFGRDASLMLVYRTRNPTVLSFGLPSEVWIFGSGQGGISRTFGLQDTEGESVSSALEDPNDPAQEIAREFERNPQAARDAARRHPDPTIRVKAIAYLGEQANEQSIKVLLDLLQDQDAHMRQSALEALGPSVENDPQVRKVMAHVMETAEDPEIRQMVADSLGVQLDKDKVDLDSRK
jgi:hypothetical protein